MKTAHKNYKRDTYLNFHHMDNFRYGMAFALPPINTRSSEMETMIFSKFNTSKLIPLLKSWMSSHKSLSPK